jgi:hypothetical protein
MGGVSIKEWWRTPVGGGLSLGGAEACADDSTLPAPAGDREAVARLPLELRRRLDPHHDQWWLLPWEAYKHYRPTDALRFYLQTRRGWLRVSNPRLRQMGQRGVCLGRVPPQRAPQPAAPAEPERRTTQSQWLAACAQYPAALEEDEPATPAEPRHWRLVLRLLGTGLAGYRFTLASDTGRSDSLSGSEDELCFEALKTSDGYSLSVEAGAQRQHLFGRSVHSQLSAAEGDRLFKDAQASREDAPLLYLLRREVKDDAVILTVATQPPRFGVFFDGTGNNLHNDNARQDDAKAPTNVAKLYELYPDDQNGVVHRWYVEGIGTRASEADDHWDMGTAMSFGERVGEALESTKRFFDRFPLASEGLLDVFGFSRGAAAARAFVNQLHRIGRRSPTSFGGIPLRVSFVGLFDTVGSIGLPGDADNHNRWAGQGLDSEIALDLHPQAAEAVYHLTAADEERANFPLSSLRGGPNAPLALPEHFIEEALPGAHADIGGGYGALPQIIYYPVKAIDWLRIEERDRQIAALKAEYEQRYAKPGIELSMKISHGGVTRAPWRRSLIAPYWRRQVDPSLAHYALERMHQAAAQQGVPLQALERLPQKGPYEYRVDDRLRALIEAVLKEGCESQAYRELYTHYIHHSHQYRQQPLESTLEAIGSLFGNAYAPERDDSEALPAMGRREVFYNRPEQGETPRHAPAQRRGWYAR